MADTAGDLKRTYNLERLLALAEQEGLATRGRRIQCPARCADDQRAATVGDTDGGAMWECKRCGAGGSVIDLVMATRGIDFKTALEHLGAAPPPEPKKLRKREPIDGAAAWARLATSDGSGEEYLRLRGVGEAITRGLVRFNVGKIGIRWLDWKASIGYRPAVPMRDAAGVPVSFQMRCIRPTNRDEPAKLSPLGPQRKDISFGHPELARTAHRVYLAEGMFDSLAVELAGVVVIGAPGVDQLKHLVALVGEPRGREFVLCQQNDPQGQSQGAFSGVAEQLRQLGGRVALLPPPAEHKDPADWLKAVGLEAFSAALAAAVVPAAEEPPANPPAPAQALPEPPGEGERGRPAAVSELEEGAPAGRDPRPAAPAPEDDTPPPTSEPPDKPNRYEWTPGAMFWLKPTGDDQGTIAVQLTNFGCKIVREIVEDDGVEKRAVFELEVKRGPAERRRIRVPAAQFSSMGWVIEQLGASFVLYPGNNVRDHARAAIQLLSGEIPRHVIFTHLGWRTDVDGGPVYLHADGAIGAGGPVPGIEVSLSYPTIQRFRLPPPPVGKRLVESVRASLSYLDLAPYRVTVPVYAAIFRALMTSADFSVGLHGRTGSRKSELAACAQRHFGSEMDARHLPASFLSTENALEALAFAAKDALLVVDDFAPTGSQAMIQQLHAKAERILRAQGNNSSRARMRPDSTLRPDKPPRGLILWTGEDVPRGESVRARCLLVEVNAGDVDLARLTGFQDAAKEGLPAEALSAFAAWFAPRRAEFLRTQSDKVSELRKRAFHEKLHGRTPDIIASLVLGLRWWLAFAKEVGAIEAAAAADLEDAAWEALGASASKQAEAQAASEPTRRFLEMLGSAIASGAAHVASPVGGPPQPAERWGWRERRTGQNEWNCEWSPVGARVGWTEQEDLYLDLAAAMNTVERFARETGEALGLTQTTLRKRLHERGLLSSIDRKSQSLSVRRMLEGERRWVTHLRSTVLSASEEGEMAGENPAMTGCDFENPPASTV